MRILERHGVALFIAAWAIPITAMLLPSLDQSLAITFGNTTGLFWLVVISAHLCVVAAVVLGIVAHRQDLPEVGYLSLWFLALSILPSVHGLTTPGILYGGNSSFAASVFLAGPIGAAVASPIWLRGRFGAAVAARWRSWYATSTALILVLAAVLLAKPHLITSPSMTSAWMIAATVPTTAISAWYSGRHLRFAIISRQPHHLLVFLAFVFTGTSYLLWLSPEPFGTTFWMAHIFDISGVFLGTLGGAWIYFNSPQPSKMFGPVLNADPLAALDLGLDPNVEAFIAKLGAKDEVTRDHVLRAAESAVQVATAMNLSATVVRDTGIAAVLHDIGKIAIPDSILNKPGQLTDDEYELMKSHTVAGYDMLAANQGLRAAARHVRSHHERLDGRGYPDGLVGEDIPLPARIVAVCDAYDAMAHDRPYRKGMERERAIAILREHAGSQWDGAAVDALIGLVKREKIRTRPTLLDHLGEGAGEWFAHEADVSCGCSDALPADLVHSQETEAVGANR